MRRVALALFLMSRQDCIDDARNPLRPGPERWIERLGDSDPETRERAESELAAFGEHARKELARARSSSDVEVRLRANRLYRKLCISRLELTLGDFYKVGGDISAWCYLRNGSDIPLVVVNARFFNQARVAYAVRAPNEEYSSWNVEVWRCLCLDEPHPFEPKDFVTLAPGETRPVGWIWLEAAQLPKEPFQVLGRYAFRRPLDLDPRCLTDPVARRLYESAVEIEGIVSPPVDIDRTKLPPD